MKDKQQKMIEEQIVAKGVKDPRVLEAIQKVPRDKFVEESMTPFAYEDAPLPISEGQTISQPYIVALMTEQAEIKPQDKVLEVGTGSGYSAAILSLLAAQVYSIERHASLAQTAKQRLQTLGYHNITVVVEDGTLGHKQSAPYDAIIVTAAAPKVPEALLQQLAIHGRLIIPVGSHLENQQLVRVRRTAERDYNYEELLTVRFVPLIGKEGW
ncbi:MAG: protein-L-isoaspartate(D-aspartate) O-methyltransferase [Parachlamydiaceae bacterium]